MLNNSPLIRGFLFLMLTTYSFAISAGEKGFSLGATRVVFNESDKAATISVSNTNREKAFLAQSWITTSDGNLKTPFIVTPPLYRQDFGRNNLRIVKVGDALPRDRESQFWINIKAIPALSKSDKGNNSLSFAYVMRVKLFYRPDGLDGNANDSFKKLKFNQVSDKLMVENPTPFHITLNKVVVDGVNVQKISAMIPPFGKQSYELPNKKRVSMLKFRTVNDFGGVQEERIIEMIN